MPPAISVLLPAHNAVATLAQCLTSIAAQSYTDFEIVVVNDGSDDATPALLERFAANDQRARIHTLSKQRGIVAALNHGLSHCRGEFIARMDADDRMMPQRLARQLRFAHNHPEADLIGACFRLFRDDAPLSPAQLRYQGWSNSLLTDEAIKQDLFLESPIAHPTFFARRSFFEAMAGYRDTPWAEDYDFLLRARQAGYTFAKLPEILLEKRDSPTRLYHTDPRCKRPAMLRAKAHFCARGPWLNGARKLFLAGTGSTARVVAKAFLQEGLEVTGFIDNIDGPPGRTVLGRPALHRNSTESAELLAAPERNFFILCIGDPQGREEQKRQFTVAGLLPGRHFLRFL